MNRAVAFGVVAVVLVAATAVAASGGYLPDRVATHFAANGRPNGWMSRDDYVVMMSAFALVVPLVGWLALTVLPRRWPRLVNLPFRDYWLAPERREATLDRLARLGAVLALLSLAVIAVVHVEVILANRRVPVASHPWMGAVTIGIALVIVAFAAWIAFSFRRPKGDRR